MLGTRHTVTNNRMVTEWMCVASVHRVHPLPVFQVLVHEHVLFPDDKENIDATNRPCSTW